VASPDVHERGIVGGRRFAPRRRLHIGLTGRILILITLAVVPALVIQGRNEYDLRVAREADIRQQVVQTTKQFGKEIGELREGARQLLVALSQLNSVKTRQPGGCSPLFAKVKARFASYALLAAADMEGRIFCASQPTPHSSIAGEPFFARAMTEPGLAVGNYWVDPATGRRMIHFAERFEDDEGRVAGVVFAGLDLAWLSGHLGERGLPPSASILIADREGNIIARLPHPELLVGKNMRKSHEAIMDGDRPGWEEAIGVDGTTRIFGYVPPAAPPKDFFLSVGQSKTEAFAAIDSATRLGIGLILAGLLAAVYAAWVGGRNFIRRPIEGLLRVTAEWRKGNYAARAHLADRFSEIGRLGAAFDEMADALAARHAAQQKAEGDLRELNATLESRIEQRTVELERAAQAKSRFLANVSHEIRTPLNGVLGMLEVVRQTNLGSTQQRFIETARRSGETLLGVINRVLDQSKIEAGKIEIEHEPFDLRTVVEEATELFAELACGKGLELACFVPADLPTALIGDAGRLRQILTNLIGNAVKFTEHGEVGVRVWALQRERAFVLIAVEVADTGIGIPVDKRRQIFEPFAQADSSTTRRYGGTGLGLSIAKHLCEMLGGSIEVTSEPSIGSTFRCTARFARRTLSDRESAAPRSGDGKPALVAVRSTLNRTMLKDQLSTLGIPVRHAETGSAVLMALRAAAARGEPFGLAIIDHCLTDTPGIELARAITKTADLPIILLTPFDCSVGDIEESGVRRLTKPIRQSALWQSIGAAEDDRPSAIADVSTTPLSVNPGQGQARVLLVEDSPVNLEVAVAILESMGCVVETATNGRHALDRHAVGEYGLIFMDCQMPEMDGFEATAEIRRREALSGAHTPIVALTASVVEDGRQRCLAVGMDDYLAKPFTLDQMNAILVTWLKPVPQTGTREHLSLVAAAPPAADPVDDDVLDALCPLQREDRPDLVQQVIASFIEGAARLLTDLEEGATAGDAPALCRASHALSSASANVGAVALSSRCQELERVAKSGAVADAARLVAAIRDDYGLVETRLSERLPRVA